MRRLGYYARVWDGYVCVCVCARGCVCARVQLSPPPPKPAFLQHCNSAPCWSPPATAGVFSKKQRGSRRALNAGERLLREPSGARRLVGAARLLQRFCPCPSSLRRAALLSYTPEGNKMRLGFPHRARFLKAGLVWV